MIFDLLFAFLSGSLGAALSVFLLSSRTSSRLYSLECDLADLQERHLTAVRRAAVNKRWQSDDQLDLAVEQAVNAAVAPEKGKWKKWASRQVSSSDESQAEP